MQKSNVRQKFGKYPFFIHIDALHGNTAYPAHTHGLNNKGWPEFMIDPVCFTPKGNGFLIIDSYDYFKKSRRKKVLNSLLKGKTVEIPINKLCKGWDDTNYPICFRLVPNTFEAVKQAYKPEGVSPDLVVVQIYVKGDDFALTDEYYEGGVTW